MLGRQRLAAGLVLSALMIASFGVALPAAPALAVPSTITKYDVSSFDRTSLLDAANHGEMRLNLLGQQFVLEVFPSQIHAPDAVVKEMDENGVVRVYALEPVPTFHGKVKDKPDSFLAITFMENGISGFVHDTEWIDFQPLADFDARAADGQHVVYRSRDVRWEFSPEGEEGEPSHGGDFLREPGAGGPSAQVSDKTLHSYVDHQFYNQNHNLHVTNAGTLVNNFRTYMNNYHCCGFGVAHLWSYKNFDGGTLGQAYAIPSRYAVTQHRAEGGFSGSDYQRGILVAHEMGHNFDAYHQYASSWFDVWCWCTKYTIMWSPWQGNSMAEGFSSTNRDRIVNANNNWNNVGY